MQNMAGKNGAVFLKNVLLATVSKVASIRGSQRVVVARCLLRRTCRVPWPSSALASQ